MLLVLDDTYIDWSGLSTRWSPADLFANGEQGSFWGPLPYYSDAAGTVEAGWGDPVGNIPDASGNEQDWTQVTSTARPILGRVPVGGRRNLLSTTNGVSWNTASGETLITTGVPDPEGGTRAFRIAGNSANGSFVRASCPYHQNAEYNVDYTFTAKIKWVSGENVRAVIIGSYSLITEQLVLGEWVDVVLTRSSASGTASGLYFNLDSVDAVIEVYQPQVSEGSEPTPYQRVGNEYDITEAGVKGIHYLRFDGTDDQVTTTLPAISGGTIVLAGVNGIWIDEIDFAGGAFSVGPGTYTGGPAGLLPILGDILVEGGFVIDRALTPEEIAQVKGYYVARGSAGLFQWGDELVGDPEFDDPSYWTTAGNISITGGQCVFEEVTNVADFCYRSGLLTYPGYFRVVWNVSSLSGGNLISTVGQGTGGSTMVTSEVGSFVHFAHLPEPAALNRLRISKATGDTPVNATIDSVSLRKLELIP